MSRTPTERLRILARGTERVSRPPVRAEAADGTSLARVYLYDVIDSWGGPWGVSAREFLEEISALDVDTIELHINSPGGEVFEGIAIRNALRQHSARVITVVDGLAASAASFIAAAGDEVIMSANSELMIHNAWGLGIGNASDFRELADRLDHHDANIAAMYAAKAGGTVDDWLAAMGDETWYSADEAVAAGLADRTDASAGDTSDEAAKNRFDLSIYAYAGREAAPKPPLSARGTHQPPTAPAGGSTPSGEEPAVAFSDEQITNLRELAGVSPDADEATILAALDEAVGENAETRNTHTTSTVPEGMTLIEESVLAGLRTGAAAGAAAREQQRVEARDRSIDEAIRAGKTTPARREHWQKAFDADAEGASSMLAALEPGLAVNVTETGHAAGASGTEDPLYDRMYPGEKAEA